MKRHHNYIQIAIFIYLMIFAVSCSPMNSNMKDNMTKRITEQNEHDNKSKSTKISDFILGGGDSIEIIIYRHDELKRSVKIDSSGKIMFPLIGDVVVVNKGIYELREELKDRLSKYIVNPQVIISVSGIKSQKFIVLGEVASPGHFTLDSKVNVSDAISLAGGYNQYAKIDTILLIRRGNGKASLSVIDFDNILRKGNFDQDKVIQSGDILYVPPKTIANISRFMQNFANIISPIIGIESGIVLFPQVRDAISGKGSGSTGLSIPAQ